MLRKLLNQILRSTLIAALVTTSIVTIVFAQDAAPTATPATLSARQVTGFLPGGQFAKIWLELRPDSIGGEVKLVADWDRENVNPTEIGFFVLDNAKFLAVLGGGTLRDNNLLTATPFSGANSNQLGASFTASDINAYTVVLYNDGTTGGGFSLTATGAVLIDGSGQVKDPSAQQSATSVATTEVATAVPTVAPTAAPTTAPAVTTDTSTTSTTTTQQSAAPASPAIITKEVRGEKMEGELPKQFDQHYLGLEPSERDGSIQLTLSFDPQDNTELARKMNFWVLNQNGFRRFLDGVRLSEVAIAAGNRTFGDENNVRVANFTANGTEAMIVVVYNNSEIPASYSLAVKGATLVDDAGQTKTAKQQGAVATAEPATVVTTAPATTTDTSTTGTSTTVTTTAPTAAPAQPTQPASTPAPASTTPQQGSTYTIKRGDSISIIARDVYGDIQLYDEICTFNRIANCNTIEVGDVVQLPLKAQLTSGATAPAAAAPAPAAAAPVTSTVATTATTPTTTTPTTTTTTAAPTPTPTKAPAAGGATTVTNTQTTTNTTAAKPTPTATKAPVSSTGTTTTTATAASGDIVAVLQANGNFSILVDLLKAAGLEKTLKGPSTFTVFAPTDSAFSTLPAGAVEQLKANPSGQLSTLLLYHVLSGQTLSANITNEQEATTMTGSKITFTVSGRNVKVQDSVIVTKDIKASNGAIHVIDKVMIPPAE